jgi:rsbT co-antagonist protein RsbR
MEAMLMVLTYRRIHLGLFAVIAIGCTIYSIFGMFTGLELFSFVAYSIAAILALSLGILYWRGWEYARHTLVLFSTLLMAFAGQEPYVTQIFDVSVFLLGVVVMVLLGPRAVLLSGVFAYIMLIVRGGGGGVYADPTNAIIYFTFLGVAALSRMATDYSQKLEEANRSVEAALAQSALQAEELEKQAQALRDQSAQQDRLIDVIRELEVPAITVAEGVLLAPIIGSIDQRRADLILSQLLAIVHRNHIHQTILDVTGAKQLDGLAMDSLLQIEQALRLLGCTVTITGVSAGMALQLSQREVRADLNIARSPQDVLGRLLQSPT